MRKIKRIATKFLLSFFVFLVLTFSLAPAVYAQAGGGGTWYNQSFQEWSNKVYDTSNPSEIFGERYTAAQVQWVIWGLLSLIITGGSQTKAAMLSCAMSGNLGECASAFEDWKNSLPKFDTPNQSQQTTSSTVIQTVFSTRPISGVGYFLNIGQRLHIIPEAEAQGFGFTAANPILNLWRIFRNLTYLLLILVIIVMAFMIMFRVKISPQTVITVQSALPKIVITLILITFSYAIAGFLIDLMYVVIGLMATFLTGPAGISQFDWPTMFGALTSDRNALTLIASYFSMFQFAVIVAAFSGAGGVITGILGTLLMPIILVVSATVLLIVAIKIFWLLLKTYVMILLQITLAPLQILMGAISQGGFGPWLRGLLANLAVYPTVGFMFVLSFVFLRGAFVAYRVGWMADITSKVPWLSSGVDWIITHAMPFNITNQFGGRTSWDPPITLGAGSDALLWLGASFVIITLIPKAAEMIQAIIQGKPFGYGMAIGEAVGAPGKVAAVGFRGVSIATDIGRAWTTRFGTRLQGPPTPGATSTLPPAAPPPPETGA